VQSYTTEDAYDEEHLNLLSTIAAQAAIAIENARLYEQARELAVVEERQRLARDLHDAVTQTLFSASLIAEVLPRIWERSPDEGRHRLEELRELTRGALAEMRTLLLELRPSTLIEAELGDLLRQLAESITGRARVPVTVEMEGECSLPPEVKVALYRIAQEALNNVAKHAGASQATLSLRCQPKRVELHVSDDGRGFDPESIPPESLGLGIMNERAQAIGATLIVESEIGHGTEVMVVWMDVQEYAEDG
jgi:signal transduction histidine kinase